MTEELLQYVWLFGHFEKEELKTTAGEKIKILKPGNLNTDAGPDFLNSRIQIDGILWIGNVEIHKKASDWYNHGHDKNKAYDNVILHVVQEDDKIIKRSDGQKIPCLEIIILSNVANNYNSLITNQKWVPCEDKITNTEKYVLDFCLEILVIERLENKTERIIQQLNETNNHIEEVFYRYLVRSFGFGLNSEPFELLARSVPSNIMLRIDENLQRTEAILFGQAGFLNEGNFKKDTYYLKLKKEYEFLKNKYSLTPLENHIWKFLRLRPANFPTIRIAQLAGLLINLKGFRLKSVLMFEFEEIFKVLNINVSDYWKTHYIFGKTSPYKNKKPGRSTYENIIINTIVPFLFVYGQLNDNQFYSEKAIDFLHKCKAENNTIIRSWKKAGIKADSAYQSQALIQLKNFYCNQKKCLNCKIGNYIIAHA